MENLIYGDNKVVIFPIDGEELQLLTVSKEKFVQKINVNYFCDEFEPLTDLQQRANFLINNPKDWEKNAYWVIVKIDERAIVGYMVLTENTETGKIEVKNYLSKGYDEQIIKRANLLLKEYENECNVTIVFNDYKELNKDYYES